MCLIYYSIGSLPDAVLMSTNCLGHPSHSGDLYCHWYSPVVVYRPVTILHFKLFPDYYIKECYHFQFEASLRKQELDELTNLGASWAGGQI